MRLGMGSDVVIREKSFRWTLCNGFCGMEMLSIGGPCYLLDALYDVYAAIQVTAMGVSGLLGRKQETPCPAHRVPRDGSPGMVNKVQNSRNARFMPGAYGKPAQEPLERVVFRNSEV